MRRVLAALACAGCVRAVEYDDAGRHVARVGVARASLGTAYDGPIRAAVAALDAGDPQVHWVFVEAGADLVVQRVPPGIPLDATALGLDVPRGAGLYVVPERIGDAATFQYVVMHEAAHARGAAHVCAYAGELPDDLHRYESCTACVGAAVLNPYAADHAAPPLALTAADRCEFARSFARRAFP